MFVHNPVDVDGVYYAKKTGSKVSYNSSAITPPEINEGQQLEFHAIAIEYPSTWGYPMWYVHMHKFWII